MQQQATISLPYRLPSCGQLYEGKVPNGDVVIFPIRGEQEELLAGTSDQGGNALAVLHHVTQQLIQVSPEFSFPDLLATDWMAALLNLVSFSYSSVITLKPKCPSCFFVFVQQTDMKDLECTYADTLDVEEYKEPFTAPPLPKSGEVVQFRPLRLRDMIRIQEYVQRVKGKRGPMGGDPAVSFTLATQIHAIDGNSNLRDLERIQWVKSALAFDLRALRSHMEKCDTGYDLKPRFACPECREEFEVQLPLDFFRQAASNPG